MYFTYSPEVIDQHVKDTQDDNKHDSTELRLEAHNDHNASDETQKCNNHSPDAPCAAEDESDEEEDQQDSTSELEVHLAILLINLR